MTTFEQVHAHVGMYLTALYPETQMLSDIFVLSQNPPTIAQVSKTVFEMDELPRFELTVGRDFITGVRYDEFLLSLVSRLNFKTGAAKLLIHQSDDGVNSLRLVVTVPADDLQQKEIVHAVTVLELFSRTLPPEIYEAIATQSLPT